MEEHFMKGLLPKLHEQELGETFPELMKAHVFQLAQGLEFCLLLHLPTCLDIWKSLSWGKAILNCSLLEKLLSTGLNMQER